MSSAGAAGAKLSQLDWSVQVVGAPDLDGEAARQAAEAAELDELDADARFGG